MQVIHEMLRVDGNHFQTCGRNITIWYETRDAKQELFTLSKKKI